MHYELSTLPNGVRVITEDMPSAHSVAVGCWVDTGSRDETPEEAGSSHFLEHLLFKGSEAMGSREISDAFDAIGAQHNAFTSKEYTCYWGRMRQTDLPLGVEILGEMLQRPAFRQEEIDSERHVVLEEINMNLDDPTDVAHELFVEALWHGHPLAPPILGTRESILGMSRGTIAGYWGRRYGPEGTVVAIAGRVDHDEAVRLVSDAFGDWSGGDSSRESGSPAPKPQVNLQARDTEQAHLVFGGDGLVRDDDRRYAFLVLDHVLGSGMSSRLFREIREVRGLAYAVHSFRLPFSDAGAFGVYVGTTPHQAPSVLELVRTELDKVRKDGIDDGELERSKGHMAGGLALSLEDAASRMNRLGRNEVTGIEHRSVEEILAEIEDVTADDIIEVAREVYDGPYTLGVVGPFEADELEPFVR